MLTLIGFTTGRTRVGALALDVLVSEEIGFDAEVSRYPVEDGSEMNDHITFGVETLRIGGTIAMSGATALLSDVAGTQLVDVLETMRRMNAERQLVTVSTGQAIYEEMAIRSAQATRTNGADGGNWLTVSMDLVKVRKVRLATAEVPAERVAEPAQGRAGATNQPAGRSTPSTNSASGANRTTGNAAARAAASGDPIGPVDPGQSALFGLRNAGRNGTLSTNPFSILGR